MMPRLFLLFSAFFAAVGAGDPVGTEEAPVMDDVPDTGEDAPVMDDSFDGQEPHDDFEDPDGFEDPYKVGSSLALRYPSRRSSCDLKLPHDAQQAN